MTSTKPTVTYFPLPGRAFAVRAALRYAKVDYNDNRVTGKVFGAEYKPFPDKAPLGALPVLDIPGIGAFSKSSSYALCENGQCERETGVLLCPFSCC